MSGTIHTTSAKPRTQIIWGQWSVDGQNYSGRRIDVDTLCHLEWIDDAPPSVTEGAIEALNTKKLTPWEQEFVGQLGKCLTMGWDISEKRLVVWNKICSKHKLYAKDVSGSESATPQPNPVKSRGNLNAPSVSDGLGTYSPTTVTDSLDEIPF